MHCLLLSRYFLKKVTFLSGTFQYLLLWPKIKSGKGRFGLQVTSVIIIMIIVIANYMAVTWVPGILYALSLIPPSLGKYVLLVIVIRWQDILLRSQTYGSLINCPPQSDTSPASSMSKVKMDKASQRKYVYSYKGSFGTNSSHTGEIG